MSDITLMRSTAAQALEAFEVHGDSEGAYFAWHLATMLNRALDERDLVYDELNRALGGNAPQAWDRIAAKLAARDPEGQTR